jgi:hypothetical protein
MKTIGENRMNEEIKQFIEQNIQLIDECDFKKLYNQASSIFDDEEIPELTKIFLTSGIDPLLYLTNVPERYCSDLSIKEVTIPSNIKIIGTSAFTNCHDLKSVVFKEGVDEIESRAFSSCESLTKIYFPDSLSQLNAEVFQDCSNLEEVSIGKNIKYVGSYAFARCSKLHQIEYRGTSAEWNKVARKSINWNTLSTITKIKCTDKVVKL